MRHEPSLIRQLKVLTNSESTTMQLVLEYCIMMVTTAYMSILVIMRSLNELGCCRYIIFTPQT